MKTKDWIIAVSITAVGTVTAAIIIHGLKQWKTNRERQKLVSATAQADAAAATQAASDED